MLLEYALFFELDKLLHNVFIAEELQTKNQQQANCSNTANANSLLPLIIIFFSSFSISFFFYCNKIISKCICARSELRDPQVN